MGEVGVLLVHTMQPKPPEPKCSDKRDMTVVD